MTWIMERSVAAVAAPGVVVLRIGFSVVVSCIEYFISVYFYFRSFYNVIIKLEKCMFFLLDLSKV